MKRFSEEFHKKALTVKLKAAERDALRERVLSYIEYHPLAVGGKRTISKAERALLSEPYRTVSVSWRQFLGYGSAVACVFMVTVSLTAEQTVPGDALYPVKVKFNEEVVASLSFSPYEKVTWETERLNRRIAEARVLASEGKLTTEAEAAVVEAVRTHSAEARREIDELRTIDNDEASLAAIHLATTLDVQSVALRQTEGGEGEVDPLSFSAVTPEQALAVDESPIAAIASAVEAERRETVVPVEEELPSFERLLAHAESDTTRAHELLASVRKVSTDAQSRDITRRLQDIERVMARALETRSGDELSARTQLAEVIARTQKLIVFMTNIDVRAVLSVEALVPVEQTDEERQAIVADALGRARSLLAQIETALISTTLTPDIDAKIEETRSRIDDLIRATELALDASDLAAAERESAEAQALAVDAASLIDLDVSQDTSLLPPGASENVSTTTATSDVSVGQVEEGVLDTATTTTSETSTSSAEELD